MTRDEIIRMALEAGFDDYHWMSLSGQSELDQTLQVGEYPVGESVFKLAALVAAAERDACVKVCLDVLKKWQESGDSSEYTRPDALDCAAAIRARGQL